MERVHILFGGEHAFARILHHIGLAKKSIEIRMFIWRDDRIGNHVARALLSAAERGVHIHIRKDRTGSIFEKGEETGQSFFHKGTLPSEDLKSLVLYAAYARNDVHTFAQQENPLVSALCSHPRVSVQCSARLDDHSKGFIFDDRVMILGGMNIEDKEETADVTGRRYFDYMAEVESPEHVAMLRRAWQGDRQAAADGIGFILNTSAGMRRFDAESEIVALIRSAERSLDLVMAYLDFGRVHAELIAAVRRGVRLNIITSESANLQNDLNRKVLRSLLRAGGNRMALWLCREMVHGKLLLVDKQTVTFGSVNFNKAGMRNLDETNLLLDPLSEATLQSVMESLAQMKGCSKRVENPGELRYLPHRAWVEQWAI